MSLLEGDFLFGPENGGHYTFLLVLVRALLLFAAAVLANPL